MKKIIFFISCFFFLINPIKAITLTCPKTASIGETISCQITDDQYIGIKTKYQIDESLNYSSTNLNSPWKKYYATEKGFSIGNVTNSDKLSMNLNIKVSNNAKNNQEYSVQLTNIEATNTNYEYVKLDNLSSKIKIVSNINTLKSLEVSEHKLSPTFNSNTTSYNVTTNKDTITIKATPTDESATISGDIGEKKLQYGINVFTINVTSVKGEIRKYNLYITREATKLTKSSDITLKSLTLSTGKFDFDKNKFQYELDVDYKVETIEVEAIPTSDKATVKIEKPDKLELGENQIFIIVTAEDGTIGKYAITVNRKEKLSNDATIKNLTIKGYTLDFKNDIYQYDLEVGPEKKLDIEVELNHNKATYKITGNDNLKNNSTIIIKVEAEDGTTKNYKIKIIKQNETNSSSIYERINLIPLISFIVLILLILIIKTIYNKKVLSKNKES